LLLVVLSISRADALVLLLSSLLLLLLPAAAFSLCCV
jgi:hypothetical protein